MIKKYFLFTLLFISCTNFNNKAEIIRGTNHIGFYNEQIEKWEVEFLTNELYKHNFLSDTIGAGLYILKEENVYIFNIPYSLVVLNKMENVTYYEQLLSKIKKDIPNKNIKINICDSVYNVQFEI